VLVAGFVILALAAAPAQASNNYLPMRNAALVAKSYQHYLRCLSVMGCEPGQTPTFRVACRALSRYVVRCVGSVLTNARQHPWKPYWAEIRKLGRWKAEVRRVDDTGPHHPEVWNLHHSGLRAGINMAAW
jgi:hypothetical protein